MADIFYQYWLYSNVYIYLMPDGHLITLPVHLIRISDVAVNGEPVIEFNCRSIRDDYVQKGVKAEKDFIEDDKLEIRVLGFPPEVEEGLNNKKQWVQLNPENTFVLQDFKEGWSKYAIPLIATCLKAFAKKELISNYENALLNLGMRAFVHVKYGDPQHIVMPDATSLQMVHNIFKSAMTGTGLATTNNWADAEVIQPDTKDMFEYDKYKGVNADILAAGGISGVIVSGRAEDGSTFASAQVSMQTAAMRIQQAKDNFCELMNKINARLNGSSKALPHANKSRVPVFTFPPVDLSGSTAFQKTCLSLWEKGCISKETLLKSYGFDFDMETQKIQQEIKDGVTPPINAGDSVPSNTSNESVMGRTTLDDSERNSDPSKSVTGRQPKPSAPEGSQAQDI